MMEYKKDMKCIVNRRARSGIGGKVSVEEFSKEAIHGVRSFHKSFPMYEVTPLHNLATLSQSLGTARIWLKDESFRFGLNAFKVLGGSYAIGKYLAKKLNMDISEISFGVLRSEETRARLGDITFVTATDGNHGRGVAWAAGQLGQKSVVFMPKGSAEARLENIKREGASASITDLNYDDTVRLAKQYADQQGGVVIQDSAREDYMEIPGWIMQGYATIIDEAMEQLAERGEAKPTHVFLQAGVGTFAAGITAYLVSSFGADHPIIVIAEPDEADCFFRSTSAGDGEPHSVTGFMPTIMAGLACGEPCSISWQILKDYADFFLSCSDGVTVEGMKTLAHPLSGDPKVISGESGAVGLGIVKTVLADEKFDQLREQLKIDENSRIMVISTEGDTDPENYARIVEG